MKKILFCCVLLCSLVGKSQKTLTYDEMKTIKQGLLEVIECDVYVAKDGHSYKVGDTLKIGKPSSNKTFAFISTGTVLGGVESLDVSSSGKNTIIKKFYVEGSKKAGFNINAKTSGYCNLCGNNFIDFEQAIESGEIQTMGMTRDQAIAKLKEAKDLVDLGMMTKEDFEKLKTELTPLIMKK